MKRVINPEDTPLLFEYQKKVEFNSSINYILEIEKSVGVDNRSALLKEIEAICKDRYWGACVFGDPMGDPGVTYVGIKAPTLEEANKIIEEDKKLGIHAMWGCRGFYFGNGKYLSTIKDPNWLFLSNLSRDRVEFWEDIKLNEKISHFKCTECFHENWEHSVSYCRVGLAFKDRKEVRGCSCNHGYNELEYFKED